MSSEQIPEHDHSGKKCDFLHEMGIHCFHPRKSYKFSRNKTEISEQKTIA